MVFNDYSMVKNTTLMQIIRCIIILIIHLQNTANAQIDSLTQTLFYNTHPIYSSQKEIAFILKTDARLTELTPTVLDTHYYCIEEVYDGTTTYQNNIVPNADSVHIELSTQIVRNIPGSANKFMTFNTEYFYLMNDSAEKAFQLLYNMLNPLSLKKKDSYFETFDAHGNSFDFLFKTGKQKFWIEIQIIQYQNALSSCKLKFYKKYRK